MKKIMILSASIGAGHIKAAEAIHEVMEAKAGTVVRSYDVLDFVPAAWKRTFLKLYLYSLKSFPQVYEHAYAWGNDNKWALWGRSWINKIFARKLLRYIQAFSPDCIISTHATPASLVSYLKEKREIAEVCSVSVITDFAIHRLWFNQNTDAFFLAHDGLRSSPVFHDFDLEKVYTTGIPVRTAFKEKIDRDETCDRLNLSGNKPTILIMGGGAGILPMQELLKEMLKEMLKVKRTLQIIVVAGNNKTLYNDLQCIASSHHIVRVFGFVGNIHEIMTVADLMISKAGGITISEALCKGLPMLLYRPLPGQENYNANFIVQLQAAIIVQDIEKLSNVIEGLFQEENDQLEKMRKKALQSAKRNAADEIMERIFQNFLLS